MEFRLFNLGTILGSVRFRRVDSTQEIEGVGACGQHTVYRRLDQLGIIRLLDIVGAYALKHLSEKIELTV